MRSESSKSRSNENLSESPEPRSDYYIVKTSNEFPLLSKSISDPN